MAFKLADMQAEIDLLLMGSTGEPLDDVALGAKQDADVVTGISIFLYDFEAGRIDATSWGMLIRGLEKQMERDPTLRACEAVLREEGVPLASRTFLRLAKRHVRRRANTGTSGSQRPPDYGEGYNFARAMLHRARRKGQWEWDHGLEDMASAYANIWLLRRNSAFLQMLIAGSEQYPIYWCALELIGDRLIEGGDTDEDALPRELLLWHFRIAKGLLTRPAVSPAPGNRPAKMGHLYRDELVRCTIRCLEMVGMPATDSEASGREVVTAVMDDAASEEEGSEKEGSKGRLVRKIWDQRDSAPYEFAEKFVARHSPNLSPPEPKPGSSSGRRSSS